MDEDIVNPDDKQEPEIKVSKYISKFKSSERVMKNEFLPKYRLAKNRLRSEHLISGRGTKKFTHEQVNLVYSIGTNFVNSVYFKSPHCNLTARKLIEHEQVENTEIKVNDWIKDNKVKKVIKRIIWDAYNGGFGAVVTDYEYNDMDDEESPILRTEQQMNEMGMIEEVQIPETDEQGNPLFERIILKNEITIQRVRPDLVRFPEGFDMDNPDESPWVGFDVVHQIDEVKNNQKWNQEVRDKIEGKKYKTASSADNRSGTSDEGGEDYARISYCFIKPDTEGKPYKLLIFSADCSEGPLYYDDFDKGHKGCPMRFLSFNPIDDECPYPSGDPWIFEAQLNAIDHWWKSIVRHVKRSNPKIAYDSGAVDKTETGKLKSNDDNLYVGLKNKDRRDIRSFFADMNAPQAHPDLDKMWNVARELISEISPKTALSTGAGKQTDTATEAKIMKAGEMIDTDARIDAVKDFITDIILDVAGMMENIAAPMDVRRELEDGSEMFDQVGAEGFTSSVTIDVDVESMQAQNKDVLRRQLIESLKIFQEFQVFFQAVGKQPDPVFWIEKLMETMYIRNIDKGFIDVQQPMVDPMTGQPMQGQPMTGESNIPSGEMPPEAIEAGMAQRL